MIDVIRATGSDDPVGSVVESVIWLLRVDGDETCFRGWPLHPGALAGGQGGRGEVGEPSRRPVLSMRRRRGRATRGRRRSPAASRPRRRPPGRRRARDSPGSRPRAPRGRAPGPSRRPATCPRSPGPRRRAAAPPSRSVTQAAASTANSPLESPSSAWLATISLASRAMATIPSRSAMIAQAAISSGRRPQRSESRPAGRTTSIQATMLTRNAIAI